MIITDNKTKKLNMRNPFGNNMLTDKKISKT